MDELTEEQVAALVRRLEERVASLQTSIRDHLAQLRDVSAPGHDSTPPGDIVDQADAGLQRDEQNDAMSRETIEMQEIALAFDRLSTGQANVCIDCGEPIGFERLLAQPTATRCGACQDDSERGEFLRARGNRNQNGIGTAR